MIHSYIKHNHNIRELIECQIPNSLPNASVTCNEYTSVLYITHSIASFKIELDVSDPDIYQVRITYTCKQDGSITTSKFKTVTPEMIEQLTLMRRIKSISKPDYHAYNVGILFLSILFDKPDKLDLMNMYSEEDFDVMYLNYCALRKMIEIGLGQYDRTLYLNFNTHKIYLVRYNSYAKKVSLKRYKL